MVWNESALLLELLHFADVWDARSLQQKKWASRVMLVVPEGDLICSHATELFDHVTTLEVAKNVSGDESWVYTMQSSQELFTAEMQSITVVYSKLDMIVLELAKSWRA